MTHITQTELLLGVDTGGTFTDFVLVEPGQPVRTHKLLSTPQAPGDAILQGIAALGLNTAMAEGRLRIVHGTTIATNAALERNGVRTALICNRGFRDLLTIGRQARPALYQLQFAAQPPPVARDHCLEIDVRCDANGQVLQPLDPAAIDQLRTQLASLDVEAVAINLLFAPVNDEHERKLASALEQDYFCSRSSFVLPESGEYERGIATWLNAWLGPLVARYLMALEQVVSPSRFAVMQSSGSSIAAHQAARRAVNLLLSGPAGGARAAAFIGAGSGRPKLLTFDMGGTSTDVALIDGNPELTREGRIGDWPLAIPMLNIHTIGAGGGSIASLDAGGLLRVGPRSAGADPGPACYGNGGSLATVTDANLVLGRLLPGQFLGGRMRLDVTAAREAVAGLGRQAGLDLTDTALGIVRIANAHMADALRLISLHRGHDPAAFTLCCFGGAGGLHVFALAEALGMRKILLPAHAGVLSALGMLTTAPGRQLSHACAMPFQREFTPEIVSHLQVLERQGLQELAAEGFTATGLSIRHYLELRYQGQRHTLSVAWKNVEQATRAFLQQHELAYGHQLDTPLELVSVRVELEGTAPLKALPPYWPQTASQADPFCELAGESAPVPVIARATLAAGQTITGPALLTETSTTVWIHRGWQVDCDRFGNLHAQYLENR